MSQHIFVALSSFAEYDKTPLQLLEASGYSFKIHSSGKRITKSELIENGGDATVILAGVEDYSNDVFEGLPNLRCISRCGVGLDSIDLGVAKERGINIMNTPGIPTDAVAELALTMFLALSRNLCLQSNLMHQRKWQRAETHLLSGRKVGLIGLGSIGQRVAELCIAFNAEVIAYDPYVDLEIEKKLNIRLVEIETLLAESDIVSLHASKLPNDAFQIGTREIEKMKHGAFLVNLARGSMVDEFALSKAVASGKIGGVGLDVYQEEPYTGALCDFEQAILTPHSATNTIETRVKMELTCVTNALNFIENEIQGRNINL